MFHDWVTTSCVCSCGLVFLGQMDHMVQSHPAYPQLQEEARQRWVNSADGVQLQHAFMSPVLLMPRFGSTADTYRYLNHHLSSRAGSLSAVDLLGSSLHVWPDFHGNRSPLADPTLKGMVRQFETSHARGRV